MRKLLKKIRVEGVGDVSIKELNEVREGVKSVVILVGRILDHVLQIKELPKDDLAKIKKQFFRG